MSNVLGLVPFSVEVKGHENNSEAESGSVVESVLFLSLAPRLEQRYYSIFIAFSNFFKPPP